MYQDSPDRPNEGITTSPACNHYRQARQRVIRSLQKALHIPSRPFLCANLKHIDVSKLFLYPKPSGKARTLRGVKCHSDLLLSTWMRLVSCVIGQVVESCGGSQTVGSLTMMGYFGQMLHVRIVDSFLCCWKNGSLVFDNDLHNIASPASD
jgi:hypothetical protein